jgi:hypothetical protein
MNKEALKKILLIAGGIFVCLSLVLAVHIYIVTRPKAPDANTRIMARVDIKQPINQQDADNITSWFYKQEGIDHVLVNPQSGIAVFTFFPVKTSANLLIDGFTSAFHYNATRFMPSKEEMQAGCPVLAQSLTSKLYNAFKHIF